MAMMQTTRAPKILVTGATGGVGTALTQQLSAQNIPFRAMVRSINRAGALAELPGAELIVGDFNDEASLKKSLQGVERTFLLTGSSSQAETEQSTFVDVASRVGTRHIVKLSQWAADLDSPVRFLRYHAAVEQKIKDAGIAYTFLRPNLFMQGLLGFRESIANQGKFFAAIDNARISIVDIRDIAAVAAAALIQAKHEGQTYEITGPEALTHDEMAEKFSTALGCQVRFENVSSQAMRNALIAAGFPAWQVDGLIEDYAHYARGEASTVTTTVEDVTGRPPRYFEDFAQDYRSIFLNNTAR